MNSILHNTAPYLRVSLLALCLCLGVHADDTTRASVSKSTTKAAAKPKVKKSTGELVIEDIVIGTGAEAVAGKTISVHYTGKFTDGKKFDSSVDRAQPFEFQLGASQVIKGWDKGVVGMKVGGKRKLTIPPALAYGEAGAPGAIPPNSTLVFDIELLAVK